MTSLSASESSRRETRRESSGSVINHQLPSDTPAKRSQPVTVDPPENHLSQAGDDSSSGDYPAKTLWKASRTTITYSSFSYDPSQSLLLVSNAVVPRSTHHHFPGIVIPRFIDSISSPRRRRWTCDNDHRLLTSPLLPSASRRHRDGRPGLVNSRLYVPTPNQVLK
jgi:hypothetical protein